MADLRRTKLHKLHTYPGPETFRRQIWYCWTGEIRKPRAGEFFLSGALIEAFQTKADLDTEYPIARPVQMSYCRTCGGSGRVVA